MRTSSEQQFGPNLSFFEHYDLMVQFVRQFFGRPINGHLRKRSRDLHKGDVIFVISSPFLWKPTNFQYILLNFGPKMPVLEVETTLHVFILFLMIFRKSFWHSHYSRACKNAENCRKSVKKTANFNGFLAIFNIFGTPGKVWISKSDKKKTEFSTISYKKKLKNSISNDFL